MGKIYVLFLKATFNKSIEIFLIIYLAIMDLSDDKVEGGSQGSGKKCGTFIKVEQSGVRRKLFQEDGTDANEQYQDFVAMNICNDQGGQICQRNWSREFKTDVKRENDTFDKERKVLTLQNISVWFSFIFLNNRWHTSEFFISLLLLIFHNMLNKLYQLTKSSKTSMQLNYKFCTLNMIISVLFSFHNSMLYFYQLHDIFCLRTSFDLCL